MARTPTALPLLASTLLLLVGVLQHAATAEERPKPRQHTVTIDATAYSPKTVTVNAGDTIVWVNRDLLTHTVTARNGRFDSGDILPGKSWTYTAKTEGLVAYFCTYHSTMKGTLRIR